MPETTPTARQRPAIQSPIESVIRRFVGADATAAGELLHRAGTSTSPQLLVAAAMLSDEPDAFLRSAAIHAMTTRDRQLVEVAAAHLAGDEDLFDALVRDHLADHPDSILAAWIAAQHSTFRPPTR